MRHTPAAIRQFLTDQPLSGQTVAAFCEEHDLKVPTFYAWKRKHLPCEEPPQAGFCKIIPRQEPTTRSLFLPSGLKLELTGLSTTEIAQVILEIDRAHA